MSIQYPNKNDESAYADEVDAYIKDELSRIANSQEGTCSPGERHDPHEVLQRNAQFLIESSKKIDTYDPDVIEHMQMAYDQERYGDVIELAWNHDRKARMPKVEEPESTGFRQFFRNVINLLK